MNEHDPESWRPCRAGEFAEVARNLVTLRRRRLAIQTVGSLCSVFLVIGIVLWLGPARPIPIYAGISCSQCRNQMPAYRSQTLSVSQMQQMDAHFQHCPGCKRHYDAMSECEEKKDCDKEKCDEVGDCKAVENCKVSRCMLWKCQAQTCKSSCKEAPACEQTPECDAKPH
ncbi:zf-HC2 domain-containing protein [Blastopirellula sp. JC732]|uniref:Zf-HC2 domain-containing protein n=1 Tax=Blastopirellula sediminis TaxID=2894196 RepID=A0A9X1MIJ5_9BACT|nr:zf-HC2 domain-containing protein [Blastopirellula sediminis]MCC9604365.1 zf-HC2 domain-containing protein [Blastopirellula sediminis]MCC9626885.1 zf-HC2 domain-containing protein [Blastopirellula sediminis]